MEPIEAVHFLVERGLVDPSWIVAGDLALEPISRRNESFRVSRRDGSGLFLKWVTKPGGETTRTVHREAVLCAMAAQDPSMSSVAPHMPTMRAYDRDRTIVVTDLVQGVDFMTLRAARGISEQHMAGVGEALARVHGNTGALLQISAAGLLSAAAPWFLSVHRFPPGQVTLASPGQRACVERIRGNAYLSGILDRTQAEWSQTAWIHGDLKFDNIMWTHDGAVVLVDWELSDVGDPAWDVGTILQGIWGPLLASLGLEAALHAALPSTRAFWGAYVARAGMSGVQARSLAARCGPFAASRLALGAYEALHEADDVSEYAESLLGAAVSLAVRPHLVLAAFGG